MTITLPYPPSANRYWRHYRGIMVTSEQAIAYKREVAWKLAAARVKPLEGPVVVRVAVYRPQKRGDLDNCLKCLLDSLNGIAYGDDAQIVELHASRHDDKKNPRVEVEVLPVGVV